MNRFGWGVLGALVVAVPTATALPAQTVARGVVEGRVVERESRAPVAAAAVLVVGTSQGVLTGPDGRFRLAEVAAGTRVVRVEALGYAPVVRTDVVVRSGRATELELEIGVMAIELAGVEARPEYFPRVTDRPTSETAFAAEEIRRAPGSLGDVSRILQSLPSTAKVNDQSNGLVVRGGSALENGFFIDGIAVPNINHFPTQGASGGPIGILNVDLVERIDFQAGGFPAEYGGRLSSFMDVTLRPGDRQRVHGQADLNFAGFGGAAEGPLPGGRGSWIGSARRSYLDLLVKAVDVGATVAPRYGDYQGEAVVDLGRGHRLTLLGVSADDHSESDRPQGLDNDMLYFGRQDATQGAAGATWRAVWNRRLLSTTSLGYTFSAFDEDDRETATDRPLLRNRSRETSLALRTVNRLELTPALTLRFGADAARVVGRYDNIYGERTGPLGEVLPADTAAGREPGWQLAAFTSVRVAPSASLALTAGVRAEHSTLTSRSSLSPRASASYRLTGTTTLNAAWGLYRQPLPSLMLAQSPGARNLDDPMAMHLVAGVSQLVAPDTRLTVEVYRKDYRHMPLDPDEPALFPLDELYYGYGFLTPHPRLTDTGRASARGLEAMLQKKLSGSVYALVGGAWSSARYRGGDGIWRNRAVDNRLTFSAEGGYHPGAAWEMSGRWVYAGGVPYTPLDEAASLAAGQGVLDATRVNASRYPAYHALNLRVDRRFAFRGSNLVVYLSAWNAYGRRNVASFYWRASEGRSAPIYQWGRLPIFGIQYAF